jgi:hypothetical protein
MFKLPNGHEFNVKYERYKQDISKDTLQMQKKVKKPTFLRKHVSLSCLHWHIDIIAPNFTNFYRQIFEIFKFMFFMDENEIVEESYHTLILC